MLYTYAFVAPTASLTLPSGQARPLSLVATAAVAAVVELELDLTALEADEVLLVRAAVQHDAIVRDLFAQTTVLPLQFGTFFRTPEALRAHLEAESERYETSLAALRDRAEYLLKLSPLSPPEDAPPAAGSGREYFLAKKRRIQTRAEFQEEQERELEALLARIARDYPQTRVSPERDRLWLLAGKEASAEIAAAVEIWLHAAPKWALDLSDPLPPYHFLPP